MLKCIATLAAGAVVAVASANVASAASARWRLPSDTEIQKVLAQTIDVQHRGVGIVVGVIDAHGERVVSYGVLNQSDPQPLNGDTEFEIGSATKVFTSLLLADMARSGEVALNDPLSKYLPPSVKVPSRDGKQITLVDLSTHTSGLPRMPTDFSPKDLENPYTDYTEADAYAFLNSYKLTRGIGETYEYSNLGAGLLGLALSRRAGTDYATLLKTRVTGPLGMNDTTLVLSPDQRARLAVGHDENLKPVANWDFAVLAPAGGLRSTANDMLKFLSAELGFTPSPLRPAMEAQVDYGPRRPTGVKGLDVGLGWHFAAGPTGLFSGPTKEIVWHNGGTGGYRSYVAFDPATHYGVVVLSNTGLEGVVEDIGIHLLTGRPLTPPPVAKPAPEHHAIAFDEKVMGRYVGHYQLTPDLTITISRDGEHLYGQLTGQGPLEIFPESPRDFFLKVVDAEVTFQVSPDGRVTGLILRQNGHDVPAPRLP